MCRCATREYPHFDPACHRHRPLASKLQPAARSHGVPSVTPVNREPVAFRTAGIQSGSVRRASRVVRRGQPGETGLDVRSVLRAVPEAVLWLLLLALFLIGVASL